MPKWHFFSTSEYSWLCKKKVFEIVMLCMCSQHYGENPSLFSHVTKLFCMHKFMGLLDLKHKVQQLMTKALP